MKHLPGIVPTLQRGNAASDAPASRAVGGQGCTSTLERGNDQRTKRDAGASTAAFPRWSVGTINGWVRYRYNLPVALMAVTRRVGTRAGLFFSGKTLLLFLGLSTAGAEPLYQQRYEAAVPSREMLDRSAERVRDHKDLQIREKMAVPPFHLRIETPKRGETFCQECHLPLPHTRKPRTRAFLNMHSRYVACETCHFRPQDAKLEYRWLDYINQVPAIPSPDPFRTGRKIDNAVALNGSLKIAPFSSGEPAVAFRGSEFAGRIARTWKESDQAGRIRLRAQIHAPLEKEGPACAQCHRLENPKDGKPMLDLTALGAGAEQAEAIQRHVLPQFFGRYQEDDERLKIIDILR